MFFDGKVKPTKTISTAGKKRENDKNSLLETSRKLREQRQYEKQKLNACVNIQALTRGYLTRTHHIEKLRDEYDKQIKKISTVRSLFQAKGSSFSIPLSELCGLIRSIYNFYDHERDLDRLVQTGQYLIESMDHSNATYNIMKYEGNYSSTYILLQKIFILMMDSTLRSLLLAKDVQSNGQQKLISLIERFEHFITVNMSSSPSKSVILCKILCEYCCISLNHLYCLRNEEVSRRQQSNAMDDSNSMVDDMAGHLMDICSRMILTSVINLNNLTGSSEELHPGEKSLISSEISGIALVNHIFTINDLKNKPYYLGIISQLYQRDELFLIHIFSSLGYISDKSSLLASDSRYRAPSQSLRNRTTRSHISIITSMASTSTNSNITRSPDIVVNGDTFRRTIALSNICASILNPDSHGGSENVNQKIADILNYCMKDVNKFYHHILKPLYHSLQAMPIHSVLYYLETSQINQRIDSNSMGSSSSMDIAEDSSIHTESVNYSNLSGMKGIEYQISLIQECLREKESNDDSQSYSQRVLSSSSIIEFITQKSTQNALFNLISAVRQGNVPSITNDHMAVSTVIRIYNKILMNLPTLAFMTKEISSIKGIDEPIKSEPLSLGFSVSLLNSMAFTNPTFPLSRRLWLYVDDKVPDRLIHNYINQSNNDNNAENDDCDSIQSAFYLFSIVYHQQLSAMDDKEFFSESNHTNSLSMDDLRKLIQSLKSLLSKVFFKSPLTIHESKTNYLSSFKTSKDINIQNDLYHYTTIFVLCKLFNDIFARQERRHFTPDSYWQLSSINLLDFTPSPINPADPMSVINYGFRNPNAKSILTCIPQVIPFSHRINIFQQLLERDRSHTLSRASYSEGSLQVVVRRDHIVEDTFDGLYDERKRLKGRVQIQFVSETGTVEAGIDGGGLFKDFIDNFTKAAFDPTYGLFIPTSEQLLTPNPASSLIHKDHLHFFYLFGKILGKAVYEGILSEPQFAGGFLNLLLGRVNQIDDLSYLDKEYYNSLMNLKKFAAEGGDVESLGLTFEVERFAFGQVTKHQLIPDGGNIPVTNNNLLSYIHRLAHYKLNIETFSQTRAFLHGFRGLIPSEWIKMFSPQELQLILSGDRGRIDVQDLRRNVVYHGGYADSQPYIQEFWSVIESLSVEDQSSFLKFVTSCPRQPLLGFSNLNPKFGIQKVSTNESNEKAARLPSAATCMNLLKLPYYQSKEQLKEKLLYAIKSNSGFELS